MFEITWLDRTVMKLSRRHELLRGWWLRHRGATVGIRFGIGPHLQILYPACLHAGDDVSIEGPGYLHCLSERGVRIGSHTSIARNLWLHCGGMPDDFAHGHFEIGNNSFIGPNAVIGAGGGVSIGSRVLFGPNVIISSENHNFDNTKIPICEQGVHRRGVVISDNCWIASRAVILDGVIVGSGAVVAAGAVVVQDVPINAVVGGVPAKVLRYRGNARTNRLASTDTIENSPCGY